MKNLLDRVMVWWCSQTEQIGTRDQEQAFMDTMEAHGTSSAKVGRVPPQLLSTVWGTVEVLLDQQSEQLLVYTSKEDLYNMIASDTLQLWLGISSKKGIEVACITHLAGNTKKYLEIVWLVGTNFSAYKAEGLDKLEQWAAIQGADEIRAGGRKGLQKLLHPLGFKEKRVELSRAVSYKYTRETELQRVN